MNVLPSRPKRVRRVILLSIGLTVLAAAAAATAWWMWSRARTKELEARWAANVLVLAGDGVAGWRDGDVTRARFSDPFDVAIAPDGTVYISDAGVSNRIRAIFPDGRVATVAGGEPGYADGTGDAARFDSPSGLAVDTRGMVYVADTGNNAIRRITPDGRVTTVAGGGPAGYRDGSADQAQFNGPVDVAVDASGRVVVADTYNDRIRAIAPDGTVSTVAGGDAPGFIDGAAADARFDTPCGVAIHNTGIILVADTGNGVVRTIDAHGVVATPAGPHSEGLLRPIGIAAGPSGETYVTDDRGRLVEIGAAGEARSLAGSVPGFRDGPGSEARFRRPAGVAVAKPGRLYVADAGNALIRLVVAQSQLELRPPSSPLTEPRFDADAFRLHPLLWPAAPMEGPHEIAGTLGEARGSDGERFHAGIDIRLNDGTPVLAARDGVVASPVSTSDFGSLNEWLRIGDVAYVHVRAGRSRSGDVLDAKRFVATYDAAGKIARIRVRRGARFSAGEPVATANAFNHVHLNVGWPGEEHNPLHFRLPQFDDTKSPTIARGGVRLYDEAAQPLTTRARGRVLLSGRVQVIVDAWDQTDGSRPSRRLGLYRVGYQVLNRNGSPAPGFDLPRETIRFDRLTTDPEAARMVFAPGSGIPFYGRRVTRFLYVATNTFRDGLASPGFWDSTLLPPGDYIVRALAADIRGNLAIANRDLPVTVVGAGQGNGAH